MSLNFLLLCNLGRDADIAVDFPCLALLRVPLSLLLISMEVYWDVLNAKAQRKEEKVAILSYMPVSSPIGSKLLTE